MPTSRVLVVLRGWAPFAGILVTYELMRDLAGATGLQPHNFAPLDRLLFYGYEPTLVLQAIVDRMSDADLVEDVASLVYAVHWLLPIAIGSWLWAADRVAFKQYGISLVILCGLAFATYVAAPTAPPWLAQPSSVRHVIPDAIARANLPAGLIWLYANHDYNLYAAFPSLHAGFPVVAAAAAWSRNRIAGAFLFAWAVVMWVAVVYLGEHYVTDVVGGVLYASIALWISNVVIAPRLRRGIGIREAGPGRQARGSRIGSGRL